MKDLIFNSSLLTPHSSLLTPHSSLLTPNFSYNQSLSSSSSQLSW
ncbi:Succinate dehydrogenase flavoprotein subunit [Nostoc sphaeroides CCNUC1]|uniref:Succinate dehydrogenase flavoprotein subunit n=1 Tax=Nostoc sphaeroides CCNUC1 TaxID=2653204 RepID=A0A5P8VU89_9NOSO|nr:Succinate dehydrogenase flavoprotein subunit [Nostoc sphaeroides CCNUC1]